MEERDISKINPYVTKLFQDYPDLTAAPANWVGLKGRWRSLLADRMQREAPVPSQTVLEIGCSNGKFLNSIAKKNPDACFVGLDWKFKQVYKSCEDSQKNLLKNTFFLRADAASLHHIFAAGELDQVWIFFPDPWPKLRQQKNRLLNETFFLQMQKLAVKKICIKTDHPGYYEWILAHWAESSAANNASYLKNEAGEKMNLREKQILLRSYENKELPEKSAALMSAYEFSASSSDFWSPAFQEVFLKQTPLKLFHEECTLFEKLFRKDGLPVYYVELTLRD